MKLFYFTASHLRTCFDPLKQQIIIYKKMKMQWLSYSVSLKLSLVSHIFFWMIKTTSSPSWTESELESIASQCKALRYFFIKSITGCLSRMITKPVGRSMRSISINRSSGLQPFCSMSERTVHAWSKSYVRGYVENASHLFKIITSKLLFSHHSWRNYKNKIQQLNLESRISNNSQDL